MSAVLWTGVQPCQADARFSLSIFAWGCVGPPALQAPGKTQVVREQERDAHRPITTSDSPGSWVYMGKVRVEPKLLLRRA